MASQGLVWTVANATDPDSPFREQVLQTLGMLAGNLSAAGSDRSHILSMQVILADNARRGEFDAIWQEWIGPDAAQWPQRACFQAALAPGLQVEIVVTAALASAENRLRP